MMTQEQDQKQKEFNETRKLSVLLRLALHDLKACEEDPQQYQIYMGNWIFKPKNGPCLVCLAGAAVVQRFGIPPEMGRFYIQFPDVSVKMDALNALRVGEVLRAYCFLHTWDGHERTSKEHDSAERLDFKYQNMPGYEDENWWPRMEKLVADLEKAQL